VSVALCVLNDLYREAREAHVTVDGVVVGARGAFTDEWASTGIVYDVELAGPDEADAVAALLERVDAVAEIPRAVRAGAEVRRAGG
jgi:hypothetical protein